MDFEFGLYLIYYKTNIDQNQAIRVSKKRKRKIIEAVRLKLLLMPICKTFILYVLNISKKSYYSNRYTL